MKRSLRQAFGFVIMLTACSSLVVLCAPRLAATTPGPAPIASPTIKQPVKPRPMPPADAGADSAPPEVGVPEMSGIQPIYFDFGSSTIRNDAKAPLRSTADWLKANT